MLQWITTNTVKQMGEKKSKSQHRNRGHKGIPNGNFITENYNTQN